MATIRDSIIFPHKDEAGMNSTTIRELEKFVPVSFILLKNIYAYHKILPGMDIADLIEQPDFDIEKLRDIINANEEFPTAEKMIELLTDHRKITLCGDTGIGKTTLAISIAREKRTLIVFPYVIQIKQLEEAYKEEEISFLYETKTEDPKQSVCCSYEKAIGLLEVGYLFDYIIIDELHCLINDSSFRKDANIILNKTKKIPVLFMSATLPTQPELVVHSRLSNLHLIYRKTTKQVDLRYLEEINPKFIYDTLKNHMLTRKNTGIAYVNNKKLIKALAEELVANKSIRKEEIGFVFSHPTSTEVDQSWIIQSMKEDMEYIRRNNSLPDKKLFFVTSIFVCGINLTNEDPIDVMMFALNPSSTISAMNIIQAIGRFRKQNPTPKVFLPFKKYKKQKISYEQYREGVRDIIDIKDYLEDDIKKSAYGNVDIVPTIRQVEYSINTIFVLRKAIYQKEWMIKEEDIYFKFLQYNSGVKVSFYPQTEELEELESIKESMKEDKEEELEFALAYYEQK